MEVDRSAAVFLPASARKAKPSVPLELASLKEIKKRLLFGLGMAKNFFIFFDAPDICSDEEEMLFNFFLDTILSTWHCLQRQSRFADRQNRLALNDWANVLARCESEASAMLMDIIAFALFPAQEKCTRLISLNTIGDMGQEVDDENNHSGRNENRKDLKNRVAPWTLYRRLIIAEKLSKESVCNQLKVVKLLDLNLVF